MFSVTVEKDVLESHIAVVNMLLCIFLFNHEKKSSRKDFCLKYFVFIFIRNGIDSHKRYKTAVMVKLYSNVMTNKSKLLQRIRVSEHISCMLLRKY